MKMADELIKDKLYGEGHNYQKKYGFPEGMLNCYEPPAIKEPAESEEAMAAYKSTAAAGGAKMKERY
jgi:hypothetical protein